MCGKTHKNSLGDILQIRPTMPSLSHIKRCVRLLLNLNQQEYSHHAKASTQIHEFAFGGTCSLSR
jgi:hypothetical protein